MRTFPRQFDYLGSTYRTNDNATLVERLDGAEWHATHALNVWCAAKDAIKSRQCLNDQLEYIA